MILKFDIDMKNDVKNDKKCNDWKIVDTGRSQQ